MKTKIFIILIICGGQYLQAQQIAKAKDVQIVITPGTIVNASGGLTFVGTSILKNDGLINLIPSQFTKEHWLDSTSGLMDVTSIGSVHFNSDSIQKIYGNTRFYNTRINNDSGVLLESNIEVRNNLDLDNGLVTTGTNQLLVSNNALNAIQSTSSYADSWVNGKLQRVTNVAAGDYFFPIGKLVGTDTFYAPLFIDKFNGNNASYVAEYFHNTPQDFTNFITPPIARLSQLEYWQVESSNFVGPADDDAKLTLSYRGSSVVNISQAVRDSLFIAQYTNIPQWVPTGGGFPAVAVSTASATFGYVKHSGFIASFDNAQKDFTLASRSLFNILPYQLLSWNALKNSTKVNLKWNVDFDMDVRNYIVEKSEDGSRFFHLFTRPSLQQNNSDYNFYDDNPLQGWNYYKLSILDKQNNLLNAGIRRVWFDKKMSNVQIFPNPTNHFIKVQLPTFNSNTILQIIDFSGKVVATKNTTSNNIQINVQALNAGNYTLKIIQGQNIVLEKFNKQ